TRIVAVPLLIVFLISSSRVHALIAVAIFILASITDWADGAVARRRNQVTTLGTLLDPIADKLLVAAALVSLLAIDKIDAWVVVVIVGRELAVTGLRAVAASVGVIVPASRLAKWKTVSQYVAITMLIVEKGFDPPGFHIAEGYGAVWAGAWLAGGALAPKALCAVAAVVGNCWSVFLGFRGGKGVATGLGALLNLMPLAVLPAIPAWLAVVLTTRYVSLGSIVGAACVPLGALLLGQPRLFTLAAVMVAVLIIARHRENITRLLAGSERKLGGNAAPHVRTREEPSR